MAVAWLLRPFLLGLSIILALSRFSNSVTETEALLRFKTSLANPSSLASWGPNSTAPCDGNRPWNGLICYNGFVLGLQLERMGLSGKIDVSALADIPGLRSVSVMNNSFSGSIPEFNRLGALRAIYLSGNQFSGEIPSDYFSTMDSMKKVFLSDNMFSGPIPSSLSRLPNLLELRLENNQFGGPIPPFQQLTLNAINLSNNNLKGEIPPALARFEVRFFEGNPGLCGEKLGKDCRTMDAVQEPAPAPAPAPVGKGGEGKIKYIVAFVTLGILLLLAVIFFIINWRRNKEVESDTIEDQNDVEPEAVEVQVSLPNRREPELSRKHGSSGSKGSNRGGIGELVVVNNEKGAFGLPDLMKAAAELLGNGGLGCSYKAVMANGVAVVVKRMREMNALSRDGFDAEIKTLGQLRHINILPILGYHYRKDEKLLIYEYIPSGSLLSVLHGDRGSSPAKLDWPTRLKIIKGIARGLGYLHKELASSHELPHGNLKSSNVLLNPDNEPLLSEYGFRPLIHTNNVAEVLFACKAPEAVQYGQLSPKCDVYCLGVIVLEILTGKFPCQYLTNTIGDGSDVVEWVASAAAEGRASELLDPDIASSSTNSVNEMDKLLYIGTACTEGNPGQRIEIWDAIRMIEDIQLEGDPEARTMQMLPSLREGYADAQSTSSSYHSHQANSEWTRRSASFEASSSSSGRADDNFAFAIS